MKKLPYGISDYEELVKENYYYVDKTKYIEELENYANPTIMFLRPRKFGKTLFTSVLENYYDINKKEKFEELYGNTYIGKHPTKGKNKYHVLRFNFSSIDTTTNKSTIEGFKNEVVRSIKRCIETYRIDFYINLQSTAEDILKDFVVAFSIQRANEKIYVIIDEYDHFANELLSFNTSNFKELVSRNGKVRKWYEALKIGTESVIGRIFITGVAPITLDSLTSGFNISSDITMDIKFNNMMGFTKEEIQKIMKDQKINVKEQKELLPILKENYDGYRFSINEEEGLYNSNMTLYFLNEYVSHKKVPEKMVDVNIASDYKKIGNMLNLCEGEQKLEIIKNSITEEGIVSEITQKFNPEMGFFQKDMVSMLYYLGYLTWSVEDIRDPKLKVPNKVMKEIYADYFLQIIQKELGVNTEINYQGLSREIKLYGKITGVIELMHTFLNNLSNRDYVKFDEKYIKMMFYTITMMLSDFEVRTELEVNRKYMDILLTPKDTKKDFYSVLIEFKYLKKEQENLLEETKEQAKKQLAEYGKLSNINKIKKLIKYTVIAVNDELYVDEI